MKWTQSHPTKNNNNKNITWRPTERSRKPGKRVSFVLGAQEGLTWDKIPSHHTAKQKTVDLSTFHRPLNAIRNFAAKFSPVMPIVFYVFLLFWVGWDWVHLVLRSLLAYRTNPRWWWLWSNWWDEDWQGKPKYSKKTCPSATLSTTYPTWPDPISKPGRRGGKPATYRLSYGTANS
jgi:hypothetical protein